MTALLQELEPGDHARVISQQRNVMPNQDPHLVYSPLSSRQRLAGRDFDVRIYRLDFYPVWALEIVIEEGLSFVWKELFDSDGEAMAAFGSVPASDCMAYLLSHADLETMH